MNSIHSPFTFARKLLSSPPCEGATAASARARVPPVRSRRARPTRDRDRGTRRPARALLSIAAGVLLSERAGTRLCPGARRLRPSAALGCRGHFRHASRHRVLRRLRRRDGTERAPNRRTAARPAQHAGVMETAQAENRHRRWQLRPGKPVRVNTGGTSRVPGAAQHERSEMMRCRPGTVTNTKFGTVPDQRCTVPLRFTLHRIRDRQP